MKVVTLHKACPKCKHGSMLVNDRNSPFLSAKDNAYKWIHTCNDCNYALSFAKAYPVTFMELEDHEKVTRWE